VAPSVFTNSNVVDFRDGVLRDYSAPYDVDDGGEDSSHTLRRCAALRALALPPPRLATKSPSNGASSETMQRLFQELKTKLGDDPRNDALLESVSKIDFSNPDSWQDLSDNFSDSKNDQSAADYFREWLGRVARALGKDPPTLVGKIIGDLRRKIFPTGARFSSDSAKNVFAHRAACVFHKLGLQDTSPGPAPSLQQAVGNDAGVTASQFNEMMDRQMERLESLMKSRKKNKLSSKQEPLMDVASTNLKNGKAKVEPKTSSSLSAIKSSGAADDLGVEKRPKRQSRKLSALSHKPSKKYDTVCIGIDDI